MIRSKIRLYPPKLADYLGCGQESFWMSKDSVRETMSRIAPHVLGTTMPRGTAGDPTVPGGVTLRTKILAHNPRLQQYTAWEAS